MQCSMFGQTLASPVIIGSGPASFDAKAMIALSQAGAGAVVTKTINLHAAENPDRHMVMASPGTLINCEKWSDFSMERNLEVEVPAAVAAGVKVIASVGQSVADSSACVERLEELGVLAIELVSYDDSTVLPMLEDAKRRVDVPVIVKLSPNSKDFIGHALRCVDAGADALTACDSMGPALLIDIETGEPVLGGADGRGWLSGAQILPFTLDKICTLRERVDVPIIGLGGLSKWQDAVQMAMAGADYVGVCSAAILKGPSFVTKLNRDVDAWLAKHGHESLADVRGAVLAHLPQPAGRLRMVRDAATCTHCGLCVRTCPYGARSFDEAGNDVVDEALCRRCGLCVSRCKSLSIA